MKTVGLLFFAALAFGQAPGTITIASSITAVAGTVTCTVSSSIPAAAGGVHFACKDGTGSLTQDAVIPVGSTSGIVGSFNSGSDAVTWIVQEPTAGVISWQIAANGVMKTGTF